MISTPEKYVVRRIWDFGRRWGHLVTGRPGPAGQSGEGSKAKELCPMLEVWGPLPKASLWNPSICLGGQGGPTETKQPGQHWDVGHEHPRSGAGDGCREVLGEPATAAEPREGSFDNPSPWQHFEPLGGVGTLDDLDGPSTHSGQLAARLVAGAAAVCEDMAQPWIVTPDRCQRLGRAVAVLNVGRMHQPADQQPASRSTLLWSKQPASGTSEPAAVVIRLRPRVRPAPPRERRESAPQGCEHAL